MSSLRFPRRSRATAAADRVVDPAREIEIGVAHGFGVIDPELMEAKPPKDAEWRG